jgi:hypothetical protein
MTNMIAALSTSAMYRHHRNDASTETPTAMATAHAATVGQPSHALPDAATAIDAIAMAAAETPTATMAQGW